MPPTRKTQKASAQTRKTTIATHRVSATDKFKVEAARKRASPLAIVLALAGVAVVASVALMFLMGGKEPPPPPDVSKAAAALDAGDAALALRLYSEELAKAEADDQYKGIAAEIRAWIDEAKRLAARQKQADADWARLNRDDLDAARRLKAEYAGLKRPWMADLDALIAALEKRKQQDDDDQKKLEWEVFLKHLTDTHDINKPDGRYGKAIVELKAYVPKVQRWRDRVAKAEERIAILEGKCKEVLSRMERARDRRALLAQVEGSAVEADARKLAE